MFPVFVFINTTGRCDAAGQSVRFHLMESWHFTTVIDRRMCRNCILSVYFFRIYRNYEEIPVYYLKGWDTMISKKTKRPNSIVRICLVGVSVLIQVLWMLLTVSKLNEYYTWISLATGLLSATVVLNLYSMPVNTAQKTTWIILILLFPVMGLSLYLLVSLGDAGGTGKRLRKIRKGLAPFLVQQEQVLKELSAKDPSDANQFRYLWNFTGSPVWRNTALTYYPLGKPALEAMKQDLEQAESFIFMEYFIVEDGSAFGELLEILERKAKAGVEVRLLYDDFGSVGYVNMEFARRLNAGGIRCRIFNPAVPTLNLFMNHRDHRKITVIDGKVGFTGGYNLADEYFGRTHPYGNWKDSGIRLEGEAVRSLTATFLELWQLTTREEERFDKYLNVCHRIPGEGFVQPFGDDPLGKERAAENVYLNLAARASGTLWFMTPYLIINDEMTRALTLAAKRGVDVRIIVPGVPDKKTVYQVSRSYFAGLASQGVRIFAYTPGFCHGKMCICDGKLASIGTSNLDYRSLYLHFENNVLLLDPAAVGEMVRDFEETFRECTELTEQYSKGRGAFLMLWQCLLRLFAPLM